MTRIAQIDLSRILKSVAKLYDIVAEQEVLTFDIEILSELKESFVDADQNYL
jgi:hypothetical protein